MGIERADPTPNVGERLPESDLSVVASRRQNRSIRLSKIENRDEQNRPEIESGVTHPVTFHSTLPTDDLHVSIKAQGGQQTMHS
jgi:hypothetical protein